MTRLLAAASAMALLTGPLLAERAHAACDSLTFSDVGWTDITATTAATTVLLDALGYETDIKILSVPVTYQSMAQGDIDVFLGNWMPTMEADIAPYRDAGTVETVRANLEGAKYTLAANQAAADLGITSFADIAPHAKDLDSKIYGIEPGNDGNRLIIDMIADDAFGMKDFKVVESSEQGMLAQVERADKRDEPVIFLGWEPHPMNAAFKMTYLKGGDDWFGPNFGGATVYTNTRAGFAEDCPNVREAAGEPRILAADGERDHGRDPERRQGAGHGGEGVAGGASGHGHALARGGDHQGWRRGDAGGQVGAGSLRGARGRAAPQLPISASSISLARFAAGRAISRSA